LTSSSTSILPDEDHNIYEVIDMDEGKKCCLCLKLETAFNLLGFFTILFGFTCIGFSGFLFYLDISLITQETQVEEGKQNAFAKILFLVIIIVFTIVTIGLLIYGIINVKFGS